MALDILSYEIGKKSGGTGGTTNYNELSNKPSINSTELSGNKTASDLGLQDTLVSGTNIKTINGNSVVGNGDIKTEIIQYSTVPTASADTVGKIIQYTGTTDSTYTNGYFYIGTSDSTGGTTTYSWENINVQAGGGSSAPEYIIDTNGNKLYFVAIKNSSEVNTILKSTAQKVVDDYENNIKSGIFILDTNTFSNTGAYYISAKSGLYYLFTSDGNFATSNKTQSYTDYYVSSSGFRARFTGTTITDIVSYGSGNRTDIYCLETNYNYSQPYTPTYDGSPATKKYVDDKPTSYAGYDATKTQVLKNINGVLTWVDEA